MALFNLATYSSHIFDLEYGSERSYSYEDFSGARALLDLNQGESKLIITLLMY